MVAAAIDRQIAARWTEEKVEPAPAADDAEFLRRTFLNIAGRIPTASEVQSFLESRARTSGDGSSTACWTAAPTRLTGPICFAR